MTHHRTVAGILTLALISVGHAQVPKASFGIRVGTLKGSYEGFRSTIIRDEFYDPSTFKFTGSARRRSMVGVTALAPLLWIPIQEDAVGVDLSLELGLDYQRVKQKTYDDFADAEKEDFSYEETVPNVALPLQYKIWLNYDYVELSAVPRVAVWLNVANGSDKKWVKDLISPLQLHFDAGVCVGVPVARAGIYYKSNDQAIGIDEQVTQNLNDVLKPTANMAWVFGFGFRAGRFDLMWRRRDGFSDAIRTLANSYNFRERSNIYNASSEIVLCLYLTGIAKKEE